MGILPFLSLRQADTFSRVVTLLSCTDFKSPKNDDLTENLRFVDAHIIRATFDVTFDVRSKSAVTSARWQH